MTELTRPHRLQHQGLGAMLLPIVLVFALFVQLLTGHIVAIPSSGQAWSHYVAALYHQIDGSGFQHANCTLANLTTAMATASGGYWRVPASRLRTLSGDTSGGLTYDQIVALAPKVTAGEVKVTRLYWMPSADVVTLLKAPRTVHISILCSVTLNTPFHTGTFTGKHNIGLYDFRIYTWTDAAGVKHSQQQVLVGDVGLSAVEYRWWPLALVLKAAAASTGTAGTCHVWYGADLEGVSRIARTNAAMYSKPATTTQDNTSAMVGSISANTREEVIRTVAGRPWSLIVGGVTHKGNGWAQITNAAGATGWVPGGALKAA